MLNPNENFVLVYDGFGTVRRLRRTVYVHSSVPCKAHPAGISVLAQRATIRVILQSCAPKAHFSATSADESEAVQPENLMLGPVRSEL